MSTPLQTIIDHLIANSTARNKQEHAFWARFGAGWWGSFVLHYGMMMMGTVTSDVLEDVQSLFFVVVPAVAVYSAIFALVLAAGVPKGSLVRHFSYGVILPAFAYAVAGALLK